MQNSESICDNCLQHIESVVASVMGEWLLETKYPCGMMDTFQLKAHLLGLLLLLHGFGTGHSQSFEPFERFFSSLPSSTEGEAIGDVSITAGVTMGWAHVDPAEVDTLGDASGQLSLCSYQPVLNARPHNIDFRKRQKVMRNKSTLASMALYSSSKGVEDLLSYVNDLLSVSFHGVHDRKSGQV